MEITIDVTNWMNFNVDVTFKIGKSLKNFCYQRYNRHWLSYGESADFDIQVEKFVDFFLRSIGSEENPKKSRNVNTSKSQQAGLNIGGMRVAAVLHQYTCIPSPPIACSPEVTWPLRSGDPPPYRSLSFSLFPSFRRQRWTPARTLGDATMNSPHDDLRQVAIHHGTQLITHSQLLYIYAKLWIIW